MTFKVNCYVRVANAENRKVLIEWLRGIGYIFNVKYYNAYNVAISPYSKTHIIMVETRATVGLIDALMEANYGYDCGENVDLFKALAAINCYNDLEQWFTDGHDWILCPDTIISKMVIPSYATYHKATASEIIEHFNGAPAQ